MFQGFQKWRNTAQLHVFVIIILFYQFIYLFFDIVSTDEIMQCSVKFTVLLCKFML